MKSVKAPLALPGALFLAGFFGLLLLADSGPLAAQSQAAPQASPDAASDARDSERIPGATGGAPELKYSLQSAHEVGVRHVYKYTEVTNVERAYNDPDSTKLKYSRRTTYYMTAFMPEDPDEGFKTFYINIDSMYFEFDNFQSEFLEYDSQKDEANLNHPEIMASTVLMNRPVYLRYSPYGEVVDYESDELDYLKDYLNDGGDTVLPALDYFLWWDRMDPKNVVQHLDVTRNLIPETFVYPDTTWQRPVQMRYDGINFAGIATMQIDKFARGIYDISGVAPNLQIDEGQKLYMYGHEDFCYAKTGTAESKYKVRFNRLGVLGGVETTLNATLEIDAKPWSFTQNMTSDNRIELLGRWQW